jgi:hypothetical protein
MRADQMRAGCNGVNDAPRAHGRRSRMFAVVTLVDVAGTRMSARRRQSFGSAAAPVRLSSVAPAVAVPASTSSVGVFPEPVGIAVSL